MTSEAVAIVGVGVALLSVLVTLQLSVARRIERRIDRMEDRLNGRMDRLESRIERLEARIEELARYLGALAERVARIEGAVCGPWRPPEPDPPQGNPA